MSTFFSEKLKGLKPYEPGEQPGEGRFIKLNTNENPYYTSEKAVLSVTAEKLSALRRYNDPESSVLVNEIAAYYGKKAQNVIATNGSDEVLAFCFAAFGAKGAVFPDVTYGFYKVFAELFGIDYREIPLQNDFTVNLKPYKESADTVFLANPNAQTGIYLSIEKIEELVASKPQRIVVIDEAYIDFGGESAVALTEKYKNLVVVQTFSKSRSLAGARVGFAVADKELIADLKRVKYSFNPYNVNSVSALLAAEALKDNGYFEKCRNKIIETRARLISELEKLGFSVLPSLANFVLAKPDNISGELLYKRLKDEGVLVRYFGDTERIKDYIRITVGTESETDGLIAKIKHILGVK